MVRGIRVGVVALLLAVPATAAITTKSLDEGLTAAEVVSTLTGVGASITNIQITGNPKQIGKFEGGDMIGLPSGIILSSGDIKDAIGPNNTSGKGQGLGGSSDDDLDAIVAPRTTHDAAVIEFDVVTGSSTLNIKYVFASEEYLEYVNSSYNDVFAFFVGGNNIALVPGSLDPVTINSINLQKNAAFFKDNTSGGVDIQYDGYTTVLTAVANVTPGAITHVKIALADVSDGILDSAVMIAAGGISGTAAAPVAVPDVPFVVAGFDDPVDVPFTVYATEVDKQVEFSMIGFDTATAVFSPMFLDAEGHVKTTMTLTVDDTTVPGTYYPSIRLFADGAESFSTLEVIVDCSPPFILGTNQPVSQTVTRGTAATISFTPEGSAPMSIQWYVGFPGMTFNPVAGATSSTLVTPAVTEIRPYWARVTNPCGSYDTGVAFTFPR